MFESTVRKELLAGDNFHSYVAVSTWNALSKVTSLVYFVLVLWKATCRFYLNTSWVVRKYDVTASGKELSRWIKQTFRDICRFIILFYITRAKKIADSLPWTNREDDNWLLMISVYFVNHIMCPSCISFRIALYEQELEEYTMRKRFPTTSHSVCV